ncbi:MAG TPA: hypothetical protein VG826_21510 [Pirellulales bacterium]|nr:hypothetical protein [Pirellulales bacterium]
MLDFRSGSEHYSSTSPYYKHHIDSGRLLMLVVSSVLLMGLIFTLGRPRSQQPPPSASGESVGVTSDQLSPGSRVTLIGGAILAAALCVVACVMFVLYRMAGPGRVTFVVRDVAEAAPDFRSLEAQPPAPTPREALANLAASEERPAGAAHAL